MFVYPCHVLFLSISVLLVFPTLINKNNQFKTAGTIRSRQSVGACYEDGKLTEIKKTIWICV